MRFVRREWVERVFGRSPIGFGYRTPRNGGSGLRTGQFAGMLRVYFGSPMAVPCTRGIGCLD
eukprot:6374228-Amphidinium_carterae.1